MSERIKENTRPNQKQKSRGIPVEDLIAPFESYTKGAAWLEKQVEKGLYKPVRASGSNGKHPPLYRRYLKQTPVTEERREKDLALKTELMTKILPPLSVSFYLNHLRQYEKDRQTVLALNAWLQKPENCSAPLLPCNERSFSIFQDEKLLQSEGLRIIGNLGLTEADFRFFSTMEPLGFFSSHSGVKQTILVCENLDTFVSVRNRL